MDTATAVPYPGNLLYSQSSTARHVSSRPGSKISNRCSSASSEASAPTNHIDANPPPHLQPAPKSAVRRWKRLHEIDMFDRLVQAKEERRTRDRETLERVGNLARRIPVDMLARQWLNKERATIETREYLIENILPCLILGLEKLLQEVMKRGLAVDEAAGVDGSSTNFNPINFIGQYLMRNNPRFSNFSEASPYIRGIREVGEQLRQEIYHFNDNKLAKLKAEARHRREARDKEETRKKTEYNRRSVTLQNVFDQFLLEQDVKIERQVIFGSIESFQSVLERLPEELKSNSVIKFKTEVGVNMPKKVARKEFVDEMLTFTESMESALFNRFMDHLLHCARNYKAMLAQDQRNYLFSNLFVTCDLDQIGLLDRPRIIQLFTKFYEDSPRETQMLLQNPTEMPLRDIMRDIKKMKQTQRRNLRQQREAAIAAGEEPPPELEAASEDSYFEEEEDNFEEEMDPAIVSDEMKPKDATESIDINKSNAEQLLLSNQSNNSNAESGATAPVEVPTEVVQSENNKTEDADKKSPEPQVQPATGAVPEDVTQVVEEKDISKPTSDEKDAPVVEKTNEEETKVKKDLEQKEKKIEGDNLVESTNDFVAEKEQRKRGKKSKNPEMEAAFAKGIGFVREKTNFSLISEMSQISQASVFDEKNVNEPQFIHLSENFLADAKSDNKVVKQLVTYIQDGYQETEAERMYRMMEVHRLAVFEHRKVLIDRVFELWDNERSGYLDVNEVETVVNKFRNGSHKRGVASAKRILSESRLEDIRLNRREFQDFLFVVVQRVHKEDDMEALLDFLELSVQRNHMEKARGEARHKFLDGILQAAYSSGGSLEPVYRAVFQVLFKDAEAHGDKKVISANFAILESNLRFPKRGPNLLRYVAATPNDAPFMVGKILYPDMPSVTFGVVSSGKALHIPRASSNSSVHFWNTQRKDEHKNGALVVLPLKDGRKNVFGTLGVDTLNDPHASASFFAGHEILFYEGIGQCFSTAFYYVDMLKKAVRVGESALTWMCRRIGTVRNAVYYMREKDPRPKDKKKSKNDPIEYVLRRMICVNERGDITHFSTPPCFSREDNLFRNYLFQVMDTSQAVLADAYGERHLAVPLRDLEGRTDVVIDIGIGDLKTLPKDDSEEVTKIVNLMQLAYHELLKSAQGEAADLDPGLTSRAEQMFDEMMLHELAENVNSLDAQIFAELKSYNVAPPVVHTIIQAVLALFFPERARNGDFKEWNACKTLVGVDLGLLITNYNPQKDPLGVPLEIINPLLSEVPFDMVEKCGSKPGHHLFNWIMICVTLIEHTIKLMESRKDGADDPDMIEEVDESQAEENLAVKEVPETVPEVSDS